MTELDFTILAIIGRDGPLSAYDVRKVFSQSVTPTWSSSQGSVYPSIRRLESESLVEASAPEGARSRQTLRITRGGRAAVESWLRDVTASTAAATPDPIRTRMSFLTFVEPARRRDMVELALASSEAALLAAEQLRETRPPVDGADLGRLTSEGVLFELRARIDWLRWLRGEVSGLPGKTETT